MTREFIMMPEFEKHWKSMGFDDIDLKLLQEDLILYPQKGVVINGTGGLRKIRVGIGKRGKNKSHRVVYVDFVVFEKIYLITVYAKSEKDNLLKDERNKIKILIEQLYKSIAKEK